MGFNFGWPKRVRFLLIFLFFINSSVFSQELINPQIIKGTKLLEFLPKNLYYINQLGINLTVDFDSLIVNYDTTLINFNKKILYFNYSDYKIFIVEGFCHKECYYQNIYVLYKNRVYETGIPLIKKVNLEKLSSKYRLRIYYWDKGDKKVYMYIKGSNIFFDPPF